MNIIRKISQSLNQVLPSLEALRSDNPVEIARALVTLDASTEFTTLLSFLRGMNSAEQELCALEMAAHADPLGATITTREESFSLQGQAGADPSGQVGPITDQVLPPTGPGVVQGIMRPKNIKLQGKEKKDAEEVRRAEMKQSGVDPTQQTNEGDNAPTLTEMKLKENPIHVPHVFNPPPPPMAPAQGPQSSGIDDADRDYGEDNDQSASSQVMMNDGEERLPLAQMAQKHNKKSGSLRDKLQSGMTDQEALDLDKNHNFEPSAAFPDGNLDGSAENDIAQYQSILDRSKQSAPGWNKGSDRPATDTVRRNLPYGQSLQNDTMPLSEDYNDQPEDVDRQKKLDPALDSDDINFPEMITAGEGDPKSENPDSPDGFPPIVEDEAGFTGLIRGPSQSGTASTDKGKGPDNDDAGGLDAGLRDTDRKSVV